MKISQNAEQKIKNGAKILGISEAEFIDKAVSDFFSRLKIYPVGEESLTGQPDEEPTPYENF